MHISFKLFEITTQKREDFINALEKLCKEYAVDLNSYLFRYVDSD